MFETHFKNSTATSIVDLNNWRLYTTQPLSRLGDNLAPRTIWHLGQFGTEDNLAPGQFGTKSVKEDNLAPRTIWHRNEKGTIWHRHEKGTIWHRSVKGTIWHRNEKRTIWHQDNLAPQCKTDNLAPSSSAKGTQRYYKCVSWIDIFVLDIFCQHLGDILQLEGVCAPFGRWVGKHVSVG